MSDEVDRISKAADAIVEDAGTIKQVVSDLRTLVKDLSDKIDANALDKAALTDAAAKLENADQTMDSVAAGTEPTP